MKPLVEFAEDVWCRHYPLRLAGCNLGRTITLLRISDGRLLIHSTAPFSQDDVRSISDIGEPAWLLDATNFHNSFAEEGAAAFPDIPYFAPREFKAPRGVSTNPIPLSGGDWGDEIEVIEVGGMPSIREHLIYHRRSKSLVVSDLLFHLPATAGKWTRLFMRYVSGMREYPAVSRLFRYFIKDKPEFLKSVQQAAALDFDRLIFGHGTPLKTGGKKAFVETLRKHGFEI